MAVHIGEVHSAVTLAAPGAGPAASPAPDARQPRWSDIEALRCTAEALASVTARTSTGERHG